MAGKRLAANQTGRSFFSVGYRPSDHFEDSETLAGPPTIALGMTHAADRDMLEAVRNEDEKDRAHLVASELKLKIQLSAAALSKYASAYGHLLPC